MNQYNLPGQAGNQNQQSLSSTTNPSRYHHSLAPAADNSLQYYAPSQPAGLQAHPYENYHQHSPMGVTQSPYMQGQQPSQYSQIPIDQQGAFAPSGQPLRNMPFTNVNPAPVHSGQGHQRLGTYATGQSAPHVSQSYRQMDPSAQYGIAATPYPAQQMPRYIPTPAQSMQSYHYASSRGSASGSNIVIPPPSSPSPGVERFPCDKCDRTFSRPHDRKRHFESQHMLTSHSCPYCRKEFSRADSLKRHLDNGCDKMPPS